ncbi:ammonia-forming cytochrome c nitrite reductase subunit c552 [Epibacterium sp. SM1979]|uniref:Ammonia-forming cytochrome c nitrite reductase subunit c552 n=1 Tax=Tritonibacter litoralis TaxID=2662264 RepID=A0A843YL20_9RHOB|nr:ammonia-forming cytochrome c nitrite reductase subunit c552 [Tritonibacter litoralis]MQQ09859.1 ammonia-forming cytochrome c nitrite reductase subunit c552 [Tritonibacter litoralis]
MKTKFLWMAWGVGTMALAGVGLARIYVTGDRTDLLPGQTAGVHHQIELACETCHTSKPFAGQKRIRKDINKTCVNCHKDELKESDDSHPIKKFKPPRMAAYWDKIDARFCTSCHSEHRPEITSAGLVTQPGDFCVACHSEGEQDVRKNRESHADLGFETCATAGCHNFHDNRALYEDFLVKHAGQPWLKDDPVHVIEAAAREKPRPEGEDIAAYLTEVSAPATARDQEVEAHWAASAHALADVTCASCHAPKAKTEEEVTALWDDHPAEKVCASCHKGEAKTFALGRHGMRRHPEVSNPRPAKKMLKRLGWSDPSDGAIEFLEAYLTDPTPAPLMSTAEARVPLVPEAHGEELTCSTCHDPHQQDLQYAAVGACLSCHADEHSQNFTQSPHFALWQGELAGDLPAGSGVTCATCHMPKTEKRGVITTNHNQNDTLRPNEKMIRPTCLECHSLEFAIDALADPELVTSNFTGKPHRHIDSLDWAVKRVTQPTEGANQ